MKELSLTTDLMFNRILAKNNFKYEDEETAKEEITKMLSDTDLTVVESRCKAIEMVNPDKSLEVISIIMETKAILTFTLRMARNGVELSSKKT